MAATTFSTTLRTSRDDAIGTAIDAGGAAGLLRIYDGTRTGTLAGTTDDVTLAGDGTVWIKGPLAFTTDDVTLAAAGTVSAGGGTRTGALAFTTDAVSLGAESQNIPPPGAFTVALDYRRPSVLQPIVHMPRVAGVPGGPRMRAAWWRR